MRQTGELNLSFLSRGHDEDKAIDQNVSRSTASSPPSMSTLLMIGARKSSLMDYNSNCESVISEDSSSATNEYEGETLGEQSAAFRERPHKVAKGDESLRQPASPTSVNKLFDGINQKITPAVNPYRITSSKFMYPAAACQDGANTDTTRRRRSVSFCPRVHIRHIATRRDWIKKRGVRPSSIWYTEKDLQRMFEVAAKVVEMLDHGILVPPIPGNDRNDDHFVWQNDDVDDDCLNDVAATKILGGRHSGITCHDGDDDIVTQCGGDDDDDNCALGLESAYGRGREVRLELQAGGRKVVLGEQQVQQMDGYKCDELIRSLYFEFSERAQDESHKRALVLAARVPKM